MRNVLMSVADRGGRGMMGGDDRFGGVLMFVCMVVLVAAAAALVWVLVRGRSTATAGAPTIAAPVAPPAPNPLANAEAILAERLARGEISPDDYRAAALALRGQPVDTPAG